MNNRLYKTLSVDDFKKLNLNIKRNYLYYSDEDLKGIKEEYLDGNNKLVELVDEDCEWNPKEQSLFMSLEVDMSNLKSLFGKSGFCYGDATLAVGLVWKPEKSRIKRCRKLYEFDSSKDSFNIKINDIELSNISCNVEFNIVIYICKPGNINGHNFLANDEGMILYAEHLWSIIVDGNASIFPIYEIEDINGPAWSYYCDIVDISEDLFDLDHIRININKSHSSYKFIHPKSPEYCEAFVNEIVSTAITMIILEIRSKQPDNFINLDEDCCEGSILRALKYYNDKLQFKINDDFSSLMNSIKLFFDKGI